MQKKEKLEDLSIFSNLMGKLKEKYRNLISKLIDKFCIYLLTLPKAKFLQNISIYKNTILAISVFNKKILIKNFKVDFVF
ncbi:hypothetical protein [Mycoplasma sp. 480]|uniref:hypothetical protein n=1 Tax=Mycoplasma sp. 480 TaxID=3440155 RepID=UPI003F50FB7B